MPHKNPEESKEYMRRYYQENKERLAAQNKEWRESNRYLHSTYVKKWKQKNPDKIREHDSTRRARKVGAFVENVSHTFVYQRDGGECQICHEPIGDSAWHVDHIVPLVAGGEHSYANTQLAHASCNQRKWANVG